MNKLRREWRVVVLLVLVFLDCLVGLVSWREERRGVLTVAFLNVGQGDAIFIDSPAGNQVLIDGGPGPGVLRELGAVLPWYDRSLDLLLATHPDADHIGGLPAVLGRYQVSGFMEPGLASQTKIYEALKESVKAEALTPLVARRGQTVNLGGGATLQILFPLDPPSGQDSNAASVVAKLSYGTIDFLLTGDAPLATEQSLLRREAAGLDVEVLKLGHHGSRTSTSPQFLAAASPDYAVISAGPGNRYGHPHPEVLAELAQQKIPALATAARGTIIFKTDGQTLTF